MPHWEKNWPGKVVGGAILGGDESGEFKEVGKKKGGERSDGKEKMGGPCKYSVNS